MKTTRLILLALGIVLVTSWLSIVFYPSVQDLSYYNNLWNGLGKVQELLKAEKSLGSASSVQGDLVVIAIPYLPYSSDELQVMDELIKDGGTLLLMDDYGYGNQVLEHLGVEMRFTGLPLVDPYLNYRNQSFPLITELAPKLRTAGVDTVVLNRPTSLELSGAYEILARSADTSFLQSKEWQDEEAPKGPFVVAARATHGRGMVIAVSDPSLLLNRMLDLGDNRAFTRALVALAGSNARVVIDSSHATKAPLDYSKWVWEEVRGRMSIPYLQALLMAGIVALVFLPGREKGHQGGQQRPAAT